MTINQWYLSNTLTKHLVIPCSLALREGFTSSRKVFSSKCSEPHMCAKTKLIDDSNCSSKFRPESNALIAKNSLYSFDNSFAASVPEMRLCQLHRDINLDRIIPIFTDVSISFFLIPMSWIPFF